jgi:hypothetical protein
MARKENESKWEVTSEKLVWRRIRISVVSRSRTANQGATHGNAVTTHDAQMVSVCHVVGAVAYDEDEKRPGSNRTY